jgi:hypothetical protein
LVGLGGFYLGGGSVFDKTAQITPPPEVTAETRPVTVPVAAPLVEAAALPVSGVVIGSKSGTKYHLPTCPGASQIKSENRIEFASVAAAVAAGYKPAANCPGLVQ